MDIRDAILKNDTSETKNSLNQIVDGLSSKSIESLTESSLCKTNIEIFEDVSDKYIKELSQIISRKQIELKILKRAVGDFQGVWWDGERYGKKIDQKRIELFFDKCIQTNNRWILQFSAIFSFICCFEKFQKIQSLLKTQDQYFVSRKIFALLATDDYGLIPQTTITMKNINILTEYIPGTVYFDDIAHLRKMKTEKKVQYFFEENHRRYLATNNVYTSPPKGNIKTIQDVENHFKFWGGFEIEDPFDMIFKIHPKAFERCLSLGCEEFKNISILEDAISYNAKPQIIRSLFEHQNIKPDDVIKNLIKYGLNKPSKIIREIILNAFNNGGNIHYTDDNNGDLLLLAASAGDKKLFNWLLDHEVDPNIITIDDYSAATSFKKYMSDYQNKKLNKVLRSLKNSKSKRKSRKI